MNLKQHTENLKQQGYVTRQEFAQILGKTDGSHLLKYAQEHGIATVAIPMGSNGRHRYMFLRADAERVAYKTGASTKLRVGTIVPRYPKLPVETQAQSVLDFIEGGVDEKKWRAGVDAKLARILAALGELLSYFEEADAADCET